MLLPYDEYEGIKGPGLLVPLSKHIRHSVMKDVMLKAGKGSLKNAELILEMVPVWSHLPKKRISLRKCDIFFDGKRLFLIQLYNESKIEQYTFAIDKRNPDSQKDFQTLKRIFDETGYRDSKTFDILKKCSKDSLVLESSKIFLQAYDNVTNAIIELEVSPESLFLISYDSDNKLNVVYLHSSDNRKEAYEIIN